MMNTFGNIFKISTFGESHGVALGGVIDGCPAGVIVDMTFIQGELDRRRPGQSSITTSRNEPDKVAFLSGVFDGKTTGTPIGFVIYNQNQRSADYDAIKQIFRPSHADFVYNEKYGNPDYRGGGRASARETVSRIVAGALAKLALKQIGLHIEIIAYTSQVGNIKLKGSYADYDLNLTESNAVRCPDKHTAEQMIQLIEEIKQQGDTIGGIVSCVIKNVPVGLGEPVFGKLQAQLASAMLSTNAAKGFEYGLGFDCATKKGSEINDAFVVEGGKVSTKTNFSGGIQGGISNGQDVYFNVVFKPVATILKEQEVLDKDLHLKNLKLTGRHDPCVLPRAVPIVEAMAALVILDTYLMNRITKI